MIKNYIDSRKAFYPENYYEGFKSNSAIEKEFAGLGTYEVTKEVVKTKEKKYRKL